MQKKSISIRRVHTPYSWVSAFMCLVNIELFIQTHVWGEQSPTTSVRIKTMACLNGMQSHFF